MKRSLLIAAAVIMFFSVNAQNFVWAKRMGGGSSEEGLSIVTSVLGNVYTTGYFLGTADFDPGPGVFNLTASGITDIFISKLDSSGNFLWAKKFGGTSTVGRGLSIVVDGSENVIATGFFDSTVDFDPGPGVFNLTASGMQDVFVCKLDAAGNFIFAVNMGGVNNDYGSGIILDLSKNIFITGIFQSIADFDPGTAVFNITGGGNNDLFVTKLDSSGNFVWARGIGGSGSDMSNAITLDRLGNVYFTGGFSNSVDFDPGPSTFSLTSNGAADAFISKLDSSGNFVWTVGFGGTGPDDGISMDIDSSGNVLATGHFWGATDFDPGAGVYNINSAGVGDVFISKLDSLGNFIWARNIGGTAMDMIRGLDLDTLGNIYITGYFQVGADFDPGSGTFSLTTAGQEDFFVEKLDSAGNLVWVRKMGGTQNDYATAIYVDTKENIFTTGNFRGVADFDPGALTYNLFASGPNDVFVHKLSQCPPPVITGSITGSTIVCWGSTYTYSINPVPGATNYTWYLPGTWSGSSITNTISATAGGNGNFTVAASNSCGYSNPLTVFVVMSGFPTISALTSNTLICAGQTATLTASGGNTYTWNPGGSGNSIVISPSSPTSYTITGANSAGCTNTAVFTQSVANCNSIEQYESLSQAIYPNPTSQFISIVFNTKRSGELELYNLLGEKIRSYAFFDKESIELDMAEFSDGVYFIKLGSSTMKVIKAN